MPTVKGSPDHARLITYGRHPGVQDAMQWLAYTHLPVQLQRFSEPLYVAGQFLLAQVPTDSDELTTALNTLVTAKDHAMRAGIRSDFGRPGSVPRPQEVVDPPLLEE